MKPANIRQLATLRNSERLERIMRKIEEIRSGNNKITSTNQISGPVEADPEYKLIVDANNLAADIDTEICTIPSVP